jgi:hypothetical protein
VNRRGTVGAGRGRRIIATINPRQWLALRPIAPPERDHPKIFQAVVWTLCGRKTIQTDSDENRGFFSRIPNYGLTPFPLFWVDAFFHFLR